VPVPKEVLDTEVVMGQDLLLDFYNNNQFIMLDDQFQPVPPRAPPLRVHTDLGSDQARFASEAPIRHKFS
jgi:hypothetical protein